MWHFPGFWFLLFALYTMLRYSTPLSAVIESHNLDHHLNAGDTQVYISLAMLHPSHSLSLLSDCLQDIFYWINDGK